MRTNFPTREIGTSRDTEAVKRHALRDQRILVARIDDPRLSWDQRELLAQVGRKLYGDDAVPLLRPQMKSQSRG